MRQTLINPNQFLNRRSPIFLIFLLFHCFAQSPQEQKLEKLSVMDKAVKASKSDEVIILKKGKVIYRYSSGRIKEPILLMSATKSIVALAVGIAIDNGSLKSENEPVFKFFPEWQNDERKEVTIKHLLNHTSGLQAKKTTENIYQQSDFVKYALQANLSHSPGSRFFYNNKATNLLPGIIQKATGKKMDLMLNESLFKKLGIKEANWYWKKDKAGNPYGMSGLNMRPNDFAKIGQFILQNGVWNGEQIISKAWLKKMLSPGQTFVAGCGYLWWLKSNSSGDLLYFDNSLINLYKQKGISKNHIEKLQPLVGKFFNRIEFKKEFLKAFETRENAINFLTEIKKKRLPDARLKPGPLFAYVAEGYLGQYLVIIPSKELVGVRLIHYSSAGENTNFFKFPELLGNL